MKISLEGINSRLNRAEVIITELENTATEITKSGTQRKKDWEKMSRVSALGKYKKPNIWANKLPKER